MIQVDHVTKEYVSNKKYPGFRGALKGLVSTEKIKKVAVDDISFQINKGEMVGYIGSNGAGKSTTIKMMTGIIVPTKGTIKVNGVIPYENRQKNAQHIGVVFGQRTQLWWDLPLSESFFVLKEIYSIDEKVFKERMNFLNEVLGFEEFIHNTVRTLSLGQRMRADLAAALLHNPAVIYLDEPTIGLDLVVKDNIRAAIREINKNYHTTVILTTHDLSNIAELCQRIIIIDKGKIIHDGSITEIKATYGITKKVVIDLMDSSMLSNVNFNNVFQLPKEDLSTLVEASTITFTFNKNKISVSSIIREILDNFSVRDIKIEETEIGDIVKMIYKNGM